MIKCKVCGKWLKNIRGYNIHYNRMHGVIQGENISIPQIEELLNRMRKLELDNIFMKYQLKYKTIGNKSVEAIERIRQDNQRPERSANKNNMSNVVKDLKGIFNEDFNYHDILKPINPIEEPIIPSIMVEILV
ncbi:hypothetical protein LCGC14_2030430 [marine sediment metagenome]|uniref:C2H2-type domain-containing protein n=1 Tax=marine sediment metagenome TaxID=412755 RepID=A0A0F9HRX8_9ZZZZ